MPPPIGRTMTEARTEQPDHIKALAADVSIDGQIAELKREIAMRGNAYKHFVAKGRLTQEKADKQTAAMLAALHTLMVDRELVALLSEMERGLRDAMRRGAIGEDDDQWANEMRLRARELIAKAGGRA